MIECGSKGSFAQRSVKSGRSGRSGRSKRSRHSKASSATRKSRNECVDRSSENGSFVIEDHSDDSVSRIFIYIYVQDI